MALWRSRVRIPVGPLLHAINQGGTAESSSSLTLNTLSGE